MKIDKGKPLHWLYLGLFAANLLLALMLRPWRKAPDRRLVVLYGHKLNGNLLALYRWLRERPAPAPEVAFLTMDPVYHRALVQEGVACCLAISPSCIALLTRADAIVCDHGPQLMRPLPGRCSLKFFDVWHGIPFKGFDADDFRGLHRFDEIWVASPLMRELYVERFGFASERVQVTGYARTDCLVSCRDSRLQLRRRLGLPDPEKPVLLFAPTWCQDRAQRSLFPFGIEEQAFLDAMSALCRRAGAQMLLRRHLNSRTGTGRSCDRIVEVPAAAYPDTEDVLLASDVLVCDWSSIAFDFLLLERPTIFLDVEAPFGKGFSLGPEYRFGSIAGSLHQLMTQLEKYIGDPGAYQREHGARAIEIRERVYGEYADGSAAARCMARLNRHLDATPGGPGASATREFSR